MTLALLLALVLAGQTAPAPQAPVQDGKGAPNEVSSVVVTAQTPSKPTLSATRDFAYKVSNPTSGHDQLARFDDPLCIKVEGLEAPYDGVVAEDIRRIARAAGARVDSPACATNVLILFTKDVGALMANLYAKRFEILEGGDETYEPAIKRFIAQRRPIAWWRNTSVSSWAGAPPTNQGDPDAPPTYEWARASHIQSNIAEHVVRLVFVVDGPKVEGRTLGELGDYIAFAALADASPERKPAQGSILALFDTKPDPAAPRRRLTTWDTAFLKAFYSSASDRASNLQEGEVAGRMSQILTKPDAKAPAKPPS